MEHFLTPKKRKKRRRVIVGSRSRRARQKLNKKLKQSTSTESSSEEEEGAEQEGEGEESVTMETSQSEAEGETHVVDVISMEEPKETIGQRLRIRSRSGSHGEPSVAAIAETNKRGSAEASETSQEEVGGNRGRQTGEELCPEAKRMAQSSSHFT